MHDKLSCVELNPFSLQKRACTVSTFFAKLKRQQQHTCTYTIHCRLQLKLTLVAVKRQQLFFLFRQTGLLLLTLSVLGRI